jgi:hypothetical protein
MCVLEVLAGAALVTTIAGTVMNVKGQEKSSESKQDYYNQLADTADINAVETRQNAAINRSLLTGQTSRQSAQNESQGQELLGSQRAAVAASGIGGGSVTAENLAIDTTDKVAMNEMYIRFQGDLAKEQISRDEEATVRNLNRQAAAYRSGSAAEAEALPYNQAATILSGASQVADSWMRYKLAK